MTPKQLRQTARLIEQDAEGVISIISYHVADLFREVADLKIRLRRKELEDRPFMDLQQQVTAVAEIEDHE